MVDVMRIVDVNTGVEVSWAELADDGTVSYGGVEDVARGVVRTWRIVTNQGIDGYEQVSEADAVRALMRDGWSNGYLMVDLERLRPGVERWRERRRQRQEAEGTDHTAEAGRGRRGVTAALLLALAADAKGHPERPDQIGGSTSGDPGSTQSEP